MHECDQKEETDKKHRLDVIHHVIFKSNKPVVYRLFDASTMKQGSWGKTNNVLTLTVLSKKFSECLGLIVPFRMLSRVDTILE